MYVCHVHNMQKYPEALPVATVAIQDGLPPQAYCQSLAWCQVLLLKSTPRALVEVAQVKLAISDMSACVQMPSAAFELAAASRSFFLHLSF